MMRKVLTVVSILFGLLLINGGLSKLFHYIPTPDNLPEEMVKDNAAFMEIVWLMPLVAVAELIAGLLIIIPRTRALGALVIFPVMVGILLTHFIVDRSGIPMVLVIWAILLWIIFDNLDKYKAMLK